MILVLTGLVAAVAVGIAILDRPGRRRNAAMLLAAVLAPVLIVADQWDAPQIAELRDSPLLALCAAAAAATLVVATAALIRRWPVALPVLVVLALPFRIPVGVGGVGANLLVPLYLVMAAGLLALVSERSRPAEPAAPPPEDGDLPLPGRVARWFRPLLAAAVVVYALGLFYSEDRSAGLLHLGFFLVPFSLIFVLVSEVRWTRPRLRLVTGVVLGLGLLCAVVGLAEWLSQSLLWNQAVIRSNDFHVYFRVNSLFWDPNVFGRYLTLAVTIAMAAMLWARELRPVLWLAAAVAVFWAALFTTYSQSGYTALLAGLAVLAALRWNARRVAGGVVAFAAAVLLFGTFAGGLVKLDLGALNKQTSGRANLVEGGLDLFSSSPVFGYGSGAFSAAFKRVVAGPDAPVTESHTEPVTVAAERGVIGLAFYLGLIVAALAALATGFRRVMPGLGAEAGAHDPQRGPPVARAAVFAALVAVLAHTLTYAGFLDDPVTWVLLAVGYRLALSGGDGAGSAGSTGGADRDPVGT